MHLALQILDDADPWDLKPGEAIIYYRKDGTKGLMLACPKCGHASTGKHKYDELKMTLTPSIGCIKCGYHGHLTGGFFTEE